MPRPRTKRWDRHSTNLVGTEISEGSVALILLDIAGEECDTPDDVDSCCEWTVKGDASYCEGEKVSEDPRVAALVRAGVLLMKGRLP